MEIEELEKLLAEYKRLQKVTEELLKQTQDDLEMWQDRYLAEKQAHQATIEDYEKMTNNPY